MNCERLRCIVIERDGSSLTRTHSEDFDETIVIAQWQGELPAAFAQRTIARAASVERSGRHFESVSILMSRYHDAGLNAARRRVVLSLLGHTQSDRNGRAELVLQAPAESGDQARRQLLELVGDVVESSAVAPVPVRLRFGAPKPGSQSRSGVFPKLMEGAT